MKTITELRRMLDTKEISCSELTQAYLDAAKSLNPEINAYITLTGEQALEAALEVDEKIRLGEKLAPLAGIPFVMKDNIVTSGITTTCGSRMLKGYVPVYDAAVWEYLRAENAVMLGKGNMDEFAMGSTNETSYFGGAANPCDTSRVAGGSSGGAAAAVSAGMAAFGIGSDTGGSIRQPASFCGIVGLKPTYGAVSRYGLIAYASSFDQIGPLTLCANDAAVVFDEICRKDNRDMTSVGSSASIKTMKDNVRGMKIGIAREFFQTLPADIGQVMDETLRTFQSMGAELIEIDFPLLRHSLATYYVIACAEASSNLGRYDGLRYGYRTEDFEDIDGFISGTRKEGFGPEVRRRILLGTCVLSTGYYDAYYNKAQMLKNAITNEYKRIFKECDCLVTPTAPKTAPKRGGTLNIETYQSDICTVPVNIAGLPALSEPCGFDGEGMPVGMQIIGDKFCEHIILSAALAFEKETAGVFLRQTDMGAYI